MEQNLQKPDNNLVWAILSTVMCCLPLGIVAIIKASSVDELWNAGKYDEAYQASADARKWSFIGAGIAAFFWIVYIVVLVVIVGVGALSELS